MDRAVPSRRSVVHALRKAYPLMRARRGHLGWWPAATPFEVCVGAILTQNTSWKNVERALTQLRHARVLTPRKLHALPEPKLAQLIRPAGYFNVKARRLRAFLQILVSEYQGSLTRLFHGETTDVRPRLLEIKGIGPETADSLLLYAGQHASFVVDAYTKRIFSRHHWCAASATYDDLQHLCEKALCQTDVLSERLDYWQDYHAQLVMVGKDYCLSRTPRCDGCPLQPLLPE